MTTMSEAKNKTLDGAIYSQARNWEEVSNNLYEAKSALNTTGFYYAGSTDSIEDEKALEILEKFSEMHKDYKAMTEALFDALVAYKRAYDSGCLESYKLVFEEYFAEYMEERKENV